MVGVGFATSRFAACLITAALSGVSITTIGWESRLKPKNLRFWVGNDTDFQGAIQTPDKKTIEPLPEVILQFLWCYLAQKSHL